jgi:NADPH:quinone reductase-like Zn-dependent oxidoreductase
VLIHGGGAVGTAAIALCREARHRCVTVGSDDEARRCEQLGATTGINYKTRISPSASRR